MISDPIGSKGVQFYFEDSGAPGDAPVYTTLVIIHGTSYHSAVFHKLVPLAAQYNLRLVLVNRQDYPGTTPSTPEELEKARSPSKDDQAEIVRDLGQEMAGLLAWYIRKTGIPPMSEEGEPGGLAVLAWSSGNATGLSAVANLDLLPEEDKDLFRKYFRTYIAYGDPMYVFGYPVSSEIYHPLRDMSIPTLAERVALFNVWITSYYQHPNLASRALSGLTTHPPSKPPPEKKPTLYRLTQDELSEITFPEALTRVEGQLRFVNPDVYRDNAQKIWYDERHAEMFPKLKIKLIWCEESILEMPYGAWSMEEDAHWDLPEETMRLFASLV
ncbi:hypothetical protein OE88DRAFT_1624990 [Heliocybe sulcata]|uniref:AB hydrolase-1 domain-containing protein n=1 Tax=Heliocybe sulcata TaxID=5364 RepID=A0A5C3NAU3_9AGAM|nr:hypothetical protein OE88DRAFT_1624990 [Heliocybe sulcata]